MTGVRRNEIEMTRHLKGASAHQTGPTEEVHADRDSTHQDHVTDGEHERQHIPIRRNSVYYRSMRRKKANREQPRTPARDSNGAHKEGATGSQNVDASHSSHPERGDQRGPPVSSNPPRSTVTNSTHRPQTHQQKSGGASTGSDTRVIPLVTEDEKHAPKENPRQRLSPNSVYHGNHRTGPHQTEILRNPSSPNSASDSSDCRQTLAEDFASSCVIQDHLQAKDLETDPGTRKHERSTNPQDNTAAVRESCKTNSLQGLHKESHVSHVEPLPVIHPAEREALKAVFDKIGFLYQEYRDNSTREEIKARRIQDSVNVDTSKRTSEDVPVEKVAPVVTRQARHSRLLNSTWSGFTLWQELQEIRNSRVLEILSPDEINLQEAMFELITSEASYYKSLELLVSHFMKNESLRQTINQSNYHFLFSNILDVQEASKRFLLDLEQRLEENIIISDICDIVYEHATKYFGVYVAYVSNQTYQERTYRALLQDNASFREVVSRLEKDSRCKGLPLSSFLILPFQRITRLKLLIQSILKKVQEGSEKEAVALKAYRELESIVRTCNDGVGKMSRTEYLINIEKKLEFKTKSVPVISHSRWLLKQGDLQQMSGPKTSRTLRKQKLFKPIYLFLFNDLLLVTRKAAGDKYQVLDSATLGMLRVEDQEDQGQALTNVFMLRILENQDQQEVSYMLKATSHSEKKRWMTALAPNRRERFVICKSPQLDSPQVQCVSPFIAQEPDELSLELADVLTVLDHTDDGWTYGERLHDQERGWFKSSVVEEIRNPEIRAQNLRECYRVHNRSEGNNQNKSRKKLGSRDTSH